MYETKWNHIIATEPLLEQIKLRRVCDTETLTFDSGSATQDVPQARMPASRGKARGHRGKGSGRYSQQLHTYSAISDAQPCVSLILRNPCRRGNSAISFEDLALASTWSNMKRSGASGVKSIVIH